MNIEDLLNKYFEGETTSDEEREIRKFFRSENVPDRLAGYKPIFAYFDEEREMAKTKKGRKPIRMKTVVWITSAAACMAFAVGVSRMAMTAGTCPKGSNYVMINGQCFNDINKARSMAKEALREVASEDEEFFPNDEDFSNFNSYDE